MWFRNDLRLSDNACVEAAVSAASCGAPVIPVYCLDPRHFATTRRGHRKTGAHRALFLLQSLADLRSSLRARGSDLLVLRGQPEVELPALASGAHTLVLTQTEAASEEAAVDAAVEAALGAQGSVRRLWGSTSLHLDDLPFSPYTNAMPSVFTPFRSAVEGKAVPRLPLRTESLPCSLGPLPGSFASALAEPLPGLAALGFSESEAQAAQVPDERGALRFVGGETAGLARLKHYLWDSNALASYFDTRNGMLGGDYSSKFSPWLAHGCLSPRTVAAECARYERERVKNKSTYWLIFELLWRDFYHFLFLRHGDAMFHPGGLARKPWAWRNDPAAFAAWKEGRTGHPLVDANMRELSSTGFMSNRGRQNVASFLTQNLGIDWRLGAEHFEATLNDYDVYSNWGNWLFAAGITGGRINVFNILKQSKDYDADGAYVKHWLPELRRVPQALIHEPWRMSPDMQAQAGCLIGVDYPQPMSDKLRGPASAAFSGGSGAGGGRGGGWAGQGREERRSNNRGRQSEFERYG